MKELFNPKNAIRIFEEYLYLTRDYRSLHKPPYFANAFFGLK